MQPMFPLLAREPRTRIQMQRTLCLLVRQPRISLQTPLISPLLLVRKPRKRIQMQPMFRLPVRSSLRLRTNLGNRSRPSQLRRHARRFKTNIRPRTRRQTQLISLLLVRQRQTRIRMQLISLLLAKRPQNRTRMQQMLSLPVSLNL